MVAGDSQQRERCGQKSNQRESTPPISSWPLVEERTGDPRGEVILPTSHGELVLRLRLEPRTHTSLSRPLASTKSCPESSHWPSRTCISWFSSTTTLCLCFVHRQGNGPWREGLSQFTELEVNSSLCGEGPHRCQATSWGRPAFHLQALSSSPTDRAWPCLHHP